MPEIWSRALAFAAGAPRKQALLPVLCFLLAAADGPADQLYREGKYVEAAAAYRLLISGDPASAEGWAGLGKSLLQLHNAKDAIPYLSRSLQLNSDQNDTKLSLARALLDVGNAGAAVDLLESLNEKLPGNVQVLRLFSE